MLLYSSGNATFNPNISARVGSENDVYFIKVGDGILLDSGSLDRLRS